MFVVSHLATDLGEIRLACSNRGSNTRHLKLSQGLMIGYTSWDSQWRSCKLVVRAYLQGGLDVYFSLCILLYFADFCCACTLRRQCSECLICLLLRILSGSFFTWFLFIWQSTPVESLTLALFVERLVFKALQSLLLSLNSSLLWLKCISFRF